MKKVAKGVAKGPVGPNGEFMTFGHCNACGKYDSIYLYGELKGICGRCVKPTDEIKIAPELLKEVNDVEKIMKKDKRLTLKKAIDKSKKRRKK